MEYCYKIKEYREEKGWSQEQLAKEANISRSIISQLETGERLTTTSKTLLKLANALGHSVEEIFLPR